jgi:hypothetical protein
MRRLVVLLLGVVFVAGFGFLTLSVVVKAGFSVTGVAAAAVSLLVLALIVVAVVGALRDPP